MPERAPSSESPSWKGGTPGCGFEVRIDRQQPTLRLRFTGYWDVELGGVFRDAAIEAMKEIGRLGRPWAVLADISKYPAQRPEVQACHATAMSFSAAVPGFRGAANLVDNTLSQMQIRRLSQESGLPLFSFFQSEADALIWLEKMLATR